MVFSKPWPEFQWVQVMVYCAACRQEMTHKEWPSHYRTKAHRARLEGQPVAEEPA